MIFEKTAIEGLVLIKPEPFIDRRGFFARLFCPHEFELAGIDFTPMQINLSRNVECHTVRGMHFQSAPHAEKKIVSVSSGRIFDVVIDLRPQSPTFKQWVSIKLDAEKGWSLFVPEGCAHGFMTLVPETDVHYVMGSCHVPGKSRGVRWNDPAFAVKWPAHPGMISETDRNWPDFSSQFQPQASILKNTDS